MTVPPDDPADTAPPWAAGPVRDYVFVGLVALVVVFVGLTIRGSAAVGLLPALVATLGLVFRWSAMPVVFLLLMGYLLVFPFGVPYVAAGARETVGTQFRLTDILLCGAVVTYLVCQYRALGLMERAMPADTPAGEKRPTRRPPDAVPADELGQIAWVVAGAVFAGQLAWVVLTVFTVDLSRFVPVALVDPAARARGPFALSAAAGRFLLFVGLVGAGALAARFAFWYWRLDRLTRDEARMLLLDTGWREARRELNRQAKWGAWARPGGRYAGPAEPPPRPNWWRRLRIAFVTVLCFVAAVMVLRMLFVILR